MPRKKSPKPAPDDKGAAALVALREQHHAFGPSKWPPLLECPCWESKPATEYSERGTRLHELFERVMKDEEVEPADAFEWHVVKAACDIRRSEHPDEHGFLSETTVGIPGTIGIHGRLDLGWIDAETADIHVADLKLACNPERDHRAQLLAYAIGILARYRKEKAAGPHVHLHMLYADGSEGTTQTLKTAEAIDLHLRNASHIRHIVDGEADMTPRQCGWCELCAKFASCTAMQTVVKQAGPRLAEAAKPAVWADYTPERKAQACALADTLAKWCAAVKEHAAADAKAGETICDPEHGIFYGTQERQGRLLPETDAAWRAVRNLLSPEAYKACLDVSASRLTAALKDAGMAAKDIRALLEECGTRGPSTLVFVRKAAQAGAA